MVWLLEAFILEEISPISKSKRHDPSANTGRRTIRALSGALPRGTDPKSQVILFQKSRDCCQIWEVSLTVRRSSFLLF
jgi:hypothetical protein